MDEAAQVPFIPQSFTTILAMNHMFLYSRVLVFAHTEMESVVSRAGRGNTLCLMELRYLFMKLSPEKVSTSLEMAIKAIIAIILPFLY